MSLKTTDNKIRFEVRDFGKGIDKETLKPSDDILKQVRAITGFHYDNIHPFNGEVGDVPTNLFFSCATAWKTGDFYYDTLTGELHTVATSTHFLPEIPDTGRKYYVIYCEGYRDNRIELAAFDADSALTMNGQILGADGYRNDIKYYLDGDKWVEFERGYERVSNNAAKLMGVSPELISNDFDLTNEIYAWLCDSNQEGVLPAAEMLLDKIDAFSPDRMLPLPDISLFTGDALKDTGSVYRGMDGLRRAVIRFLAEASTDNTSELWLYSDQDMSWMVGAEDFRLKWFALMAECVRNGVRIKIIHNIDRGMTEMLAAITSWLPLYMFGTIEPYYCTKRTDDRFSHTLFLRRNKSCINAFLIRGTEGDGYYNYHTDKDMLDYLEGGYKNLLKVSKPLVKLYGGDTIQTLLSETGSAENESTVREGLSLATMPKELLLSMLERAGIDGAEHDKIVNRWETESSFFRATLKTGYYHELIPIIRDEVVFTSGMQSDIADGVNYTPSELSRHIENILSLMDKYTGYRVYILPEAPFSNMRIAVDNKRVIVSRRKSPQMSFVFTHPLMHDAFENYIKQLKGRCEQDKKASRNALQAYL